jgi:hypothetical protein
MDRHEDRILVYVDEIHGCSKYPVFASCSVKISIRPSPILYVDAYLGTLFWSTNLTLPYKTKHQRTDD